MYHTVVTRIAHNLVSYDKDLRLTIDEENDLIICKEVYKKLKENGKPIDFTIMDVIDIIEENPELIEIKKNVK